MLEQTFLFLPGVHERMERRLWEEGITTWDHLLDATAIRGVSRARLGMWQHRLRQVKELLETEHGLDVLRRLLGSRHLWRAWGSLMDEPRFLDIETTERYSEVTVVGVSDGDFYQALVMGRNLDNHSLRRVLQGATCIITFNGSSFDLPILDRVFPGAVPEVPHLDLRHICAQAGLRGGLKRIEHQLRIRRAAAIRETDGADAIMLWYRAQRGEEAALHELVDYNAADVLNLKPLLDLVVPALWGHTRHGVPLPFPPCVIEQRSEDTPEG